MGCTSNYLPVLGLTPQVLNAWKFQARRAGDRSNASKSPGLAPQTAAAHIHGLALQIYQSWGVSPRFLTSENFKPAERATGAMHQNRRGWHRKRLPPIFMGCTSNHLPVLGLTPQALRSRLLRRLQALRLRLLRRLQALCSRLLRRLQALRLRLLRRLFV